MESFFRNFATFLPERKGNETEFVNPCPNSFNTLSEFVALIWHQTYFWPNFFSLKHLEYFLLDLVLVMPQQLQLPKGKKKVIIFITVRAVMENDIYIILSYYIHDCACCYGK